jgi:flagellar hook assembly protein FlgD
MIHTTTSLMYDDILTLSGVYNYYITASYGEQSESAASNIVVVEFTATGIAIPGNIPDVTRLGSNYPNPFTETTKMRFDISKDGDVWIEIFKISGEKVRTFVMHNARAGQYEMIWDGKDDQGTDVPAGVYIYHLKSGTYLHSKKMILWR